MQEIINNYIESKLEDTYKKIIEKTNKVSYYNSYDVFMVLKDYGYIFDISLDEAYLYLPAKGFSFENINSLTNGFIDDENSKIYAIKMDKHFNLFVVSYKNNYIKKYYSVNISEETLPMILSLEVMMRYS